MTLTKKDFKVTYMNWTKKREHPEPRWVIDKDASDVNISEILQGLKLRELVEKKLEDIRYLRNKNELLTDFSSNLDWYLTELLEESEKK